jgi:CheY-like chemotaxis protein
MNSQSTILLVEDDENDVFFVKRVFQLNNFTNPLQVAENGETALAYLKGEGIYADRQKYPLPMLIFLDIKMPRVNGFEVLARMRGDEALKNIPVVMLSSSSMAEDKGKARQLGATAYITKPLEAKELQRIYRIVVEYWELLAQHK